MSEYRLASMLDVIELQMIIAKLEIIKSGIKSALFSKISKLKSEQFARAIDRVQIAARMV